MKQLATFLFALLTIATLRAQCDVTQSEIIIEILTDDYAYESSYTITTLDGTVLFANDDLPENATVYTDTICVDAGICVAFNMFDTANDGICCGYGLGEYNLYVNGELAITGGEFGGEVTEYLDCPPGSTCTDAFTATLGGFTTVFDDTWYEFTPAEVGMYMIGTCLPNNDCNTTIWVYSDCANVVDNTVQGTYVFNDDNDNCGELAELSVALDANVTYYIRIGSADGDCNGQNFSWNLDYLGPVVGCTDPTACNYHPLATVDDGNCIYPGDPACPGAPDLLVREDVFANSLYIDYLVNADNCLLEEGCLAGYGTRELLRFTTHIDNIGEFDYYIGTPPADPADADEQWEFDACHNHWHYEGYAEYRVYNDAGFALPLGFKNGFCVLDLVCDAGTAQYSCGNQGISAGCGDIYGASLSCQWFDITELPVGQYTFVIVVNWDQSPDALGFLETTYDNNWAQVCLDITRDPITNEASFTILEDCPTVVDCEGTAYGDAQQDCAGNCNGTRLQGDITVNDARNTDDILMYADECLLDTMTASQCFDLNADDDISVTDLSLLLHCTLHEGQSTQPGHNHIPCNFPYGVTNPNHLVTLGVGDYNLDEKWFDIGILNPQNRVAAFEFEISGATIDQVESLIPDYALTIHHDAREILGFSYQEETLAKHNAYMPFLRVHVADWTDTEVCIADITAIVNDQLEETLHAAWNCATIPTSLITVPLRNELNATIVPNPVRFAATIQFDNPARKTHQIEVLDAQGKVMLQATNINANYLKINTIDYPKGMYFFRVNGGDKVGFGKFVVE